MVFSALLAWRNKLLKSRYIFHMAIWQSIFIRKKLFKHLRILFKIGRFYVFKHMRIHFLVERFYVCLYVFIPVWLWTVFLSRCFKAFWMFGRKWQSSIFGKETRMFQNGSFLTKFGPKILYVLSSKSATGIFVSFRVMLSHYIWKIVTEIYIWKKSLAVPEWVI